MAYGLTRNDIEKLRPGDYLSVTFDTKHGVPIESAHWGPWYRIIRIAGRGISSMDGKAYVHFATELRPRVEISGRVREGDQRVQIRKGQLAQGIELQGPSDCDAQTRK